MNFVKQQIDTPVKACGWGACADREAETERYGFSVLLYGMDPRVPQAFPAHLGLHVCRDCRDRITLENCELMKGEQLQMYSAVFATATQGFHSDTTHPTRVLDETKTKIAWRSVGRYGKRAEAVQ